jgi:hypothetical protein
MKERDSDSRARQPESMLLEKVSVDMNTSMRCSDVYGVRLGRDGYYVGFCMNE